MAVWTFTSSDFSKQSEKTLQKHFTYTQFKNGLGFSVILGTQKSITNLYRPDNHYSLPGVGKDGTVSDLLVFEWHIELDLDLELFSRFVVLVLD